MMKTYRFISIVILALIATTGVAHAQEVEKKEKIKIELVSEADGEKAEFSKEYSSKEEMENDPELKAWKEKYGKGDHNVWIQKDGDSTVDFDSDGANIFFLDSESGDDVVEIKVEKLYDGTIRVIRNGEEIDIDDIDSEITHSFENEDGQVKVRVLKSNDGEMEWNTDDAQHIDVEKTDGRLIVRDKDGNVIHESDGDANTFFFKTEDGEKRVVLNSGDVSEELHEIIVEKEGEGEERIIIKKHISYTVHIEDLHEDDELFNELKVEETKPLELEDLSFYPNPNNGRFNIAFSGKAKPTRYRILNMAGQEVMSKNLPEFSGNYEEEVDITNREPGIYLLQIFQGNRAVSKKIVIE